MWQIQPCDSPFLGGQGEVKALPTRLNFGRGKLSHGGEFFVLGTPKPVNISADALKASCRYFLNFQLHTGCKIVI